MLLTNEETTPKGYVDFGLPSTTGIYNDSPDYLAYKRYEEIHRFKVFELPIIIAILFGVIFVALKIQKYAKRNGGWRAMFVNILGVIFKKIKKAKLKVDNFTNDVDRASRD